MDHTEAIVQINNLIDHNFCNEMIKIIDTKAIHSMETMDGVQKHIRNVSGYTLKSNIDEDKIIFEKINNLIEKLYTYYKTKFLRVLDNNKINQIDMLKYSIGGKYEVHTDTMTDNTRNISIIINLNNDYEGGNLLFCNPLKISEEIKELKLEKGSIVFFPSSFMYPHGIKSITKGTRYSIVAWLQ
jgi:predicted 2-oxoglutarate/Fe(II)-dependent dioxygenase YbiX